MVARLWAAWPEATPLRTPVWGGGAMTAKGDLLSLGWAGVMCRLNVM